MLHIAPWSAVAAVVTLLTVAVALLLIVAQKRTNIHEEQEEKVIGENFALLALLQAVDACASPSFRCPVIRASVFVVISPRCY